MEGISQNIKKLLSGKAEAVRVQSEAELIRAKTEAKNAKLNRMMMMNMFDARTPTNENTTVVMKRKIIIESDEDDEIDDEDDENNDEDDILD